MPEAVSLLTLSYSVPDAFDAFTKQGAESLKCSGPLKCLFYAVLILANSVSPLHRGKATSSTVRPPLASRGSSL